MDTLVVLFRAVAFLCRPRAALKTPTKSLANNIVGLKRGTWNSQQKRRPVSDERHCHHSRFGERWSAISVKYQGSGSSTGWLEARKTFSSAHDSIYILSLAVYSL
jgi:hypothetical protein